jgi:large subunit ribosomal protein L10
LGDGTRVFACSLPAKTFYFLKGGKTLAITRERKAEMLEQYKAWISSSRAVFVTEYTGLDMKRFDELRAKLREVGAEYHVLKNTLSKRVLDEVGYEIDEAVFTGSTAVGFAFEDSPAAAKAISEFASRVDFVKIKGGYLGQRQISAADIKALAELPPLPVLRSQLMGVIQAPASKLVRTLAEPGRGIAAVVRAFSEKDAAAA